MGDCKYCGKPAGLLKSAHKQCKATYNDGRDQIVKLIKVAVGTGSQIKQLRSAVADVARKALVPGEEPTSPRFQ